MLAGVGEFGERGVLQREADGPVRVGDDRLCQRPDARLQSTSIYRTSSQIPCASGVVIVHH